MPKDAVGTLLVMKTSTLLKDDQSQAEGLVIDVIGRLDTESLEEDYAVITEVIELLQEEQASMAVAVLKRQKKKAAKKK